MTQVKQESALVREQREVQRSLMEAAAMRITDRHHATGAALMTWINAHNLVDEWKTAILAIGSELEVSPVILEQIVGPVGDWRDGEK